MYHRNESNNKKKIPTTAKSTEREKKMGVRVVMEIRFESNEGIAHIYRKTHKNTHAHFDEKNVST